MSKYRKQFKKGVLELGILKLLSERNHYGYSLIQEVEERSNGSITIKDGTLYPILYRLEDRDWIESYWETSEEARGKPRKYYRLTTQGQEEYKNMLDEYNDVTMGIKRLLNQGEDE